jgi:NAD(P)-dependent dehydrogenase (short-subunit alcohol dehydrogenase family)
MAHSGQRKVAFVTGASTGIGRATAEAFVARGYATALIDTNEADGRRAEAQLRSAGECVFIPCDVSDDAAVAEAVARTVQTFGRLDAAFHAAGVPVSQAAPTAEASLHHWNRQIAVDLTGIFSCIRHEVPHMLQAGGGAIVNCASMGGLVGARAVPANISSKHGVVGLTKAAALDYARQNIRVNVICPGPIDTEMFRRAVAPEARGALADSIPMGRFGRPEEVAALALFLCDDSAAFVTGQAIAIDGGWTAA